MPSIGLSRAALPALVIAVIGLGAAPEASAGPLGFSVSAHGHYGIGFNEVDRAPQLSGGAPSAYQLGCGGRIGYSPLNIYLGVLADYYFGSSDPVQGIEQSANAFHIAGEVGYNLSFIPVLGLRPYVGFGLISFGGEFGGFDLSGGDSFALSPGISTDFSIAGPVFAQLDARFLIPTENLEEVEKSLTIALGVGIKL